MSGEKKAADGRHVRFRDFGRKRLSKEHPLTEAQNLLEFSQASGNL
jgi:hypothetical protein